ncbi:MAG: hypothetical protein K2N72_14395 [Oscillospiraceae bacterium]|nr:hypothetical protein [Oscillospiraceae bacterium]
MDRQTDSRLDSVSERVNFKYLLISCVLFLGFGILKLGEEWSIVDSADSMIWVEIDRFGTVGLLFYTVIFSGLECIGSAPLLMAAASLMYRALNGIGAGRLGGFLRAEVWLRSMAVLLPFMVAMNLYNTLFWNIFSVDVDRVGTLLLLTLLQSLVGCVYYGFAACDPMKNIKLGKIYKAGLKRAVRRPGRLIMTAVLCAAAYYLLFTLPFKALNETVLDYRICIAILVILDSLALFAQSLIFYIVMLQKKKAVKVILDEKDRVV